ncbi:MAG TPA: hypothetical protein PKC80_06955 [Burkholderiaceae bacterium]|nr:hypothetical protein [Burkholderiaceae bacterium]
MNELPTTATTVSSPVNRKARLGLLLACVAAGTVIGWVGQHFTGNDWWYAAIFGVTAIAWLLVANPDDCNCNAVCMSKNIRN